MCTQWTTYRTRFLIRAMQLDEPLSFVDCIGREHSGRKGDYLVLSSDGSKRIAPREIFEDIYVPLDQPAEPFPIGTDLSQFAQNGAALLDEGSGQRTIERRSSGLRPGGHLQQRRARV